MYAEYQSSGYIHDNEDIEKFIKENRLVPSEHAANNQECYPLYDDGTCYYTNDTGVIYRITLSEIYLASGTGNDKLLETFEFKN